MTGRLLGPATCLPHKDGGVPLSALPKTQQASFPACSPHYPYVLSISKGSCEHHFLKSWYDSTWGMNLRYTDCEADAVGRSSVITCQMLLCLNPSLSEISQIVMYQLSSCTIFFASSTLVSVLLMEGLVHLQSSLTFSRPLNFLCQRQTIQ